jgi:tRNA(fMet)-specific endonuclease VapC
MVKYLLDTNVLSEAAKEKPDESFLEKLRRYEYEIATAATVWHELRYGCERLPVSRKRELIASFLRDVKQTVPILPYDDEAAKWHAGECARLASQGLTPSFPDAQIAAVAAVKRLILVTRNLSDFEHFSGLTIENWHTAQGIYHS